MRPWNNTFCIAPLGGLLNRLKRNVPRNVRRPADPPMRRHVSPYRRYADPFPLLPYRRYALTELDGRPFFHADIVSEDALCFAHDHVSIRSG
jgi:hypothetical protein